MRRIRASALAQPRFKADPYPFYARMRAESPVFEVVVPFIGRGFVGCSSAELTTELGHSSDEAGHGHQRPVIHRDHMMLAD